MRSPSNNRRKALLSLKQRINRQLRALKNIRAELGELNGDHFMKPMAPDNHPWMLGIGKSAKELREMLTRVQQLLE
jgi:hypothetical protein